MSVVEERAGKGRQLHTGAVNATYHCAQPSVSNFTTQMMKLVVLERRNKEVSMELGLHQSDVAQLMQEVTLTKKDGRILAFLTDGSVFHIFDITVSRDRKVIFPSHLHQSHIRDNAQKLKLLC